MTTAVALRAMLWIACLAWAQAATAQFDRDWKIFVVPFSHTDVGFTAPVPDVIKAHRTYLDKVVDYVNQTQDYPPESRYKWTIEITWVLEDYLANRSPEQIEALMHHIRNGSIEVAAMHFSMQTDLAGPEELVRSLYYARELQEMYGIPVRTAVTNDTPGFTWSLAQLLARSGIPYASLAMNSFLSEFYSTTTLPNLFYWEAQSGDRTLLWRSMHPNWAYLEGAVWGLYGSYQGMERRITAQLHKLAAEDYPYDVVLINAATGDNRAPNVRISENARTWNARHQAATMYVSTFADFFNYVDNHVAEEIPVLRGDAPNWWSWFFAASSTGGFFASRNAQALLPGAETFASIADGLVPGYRYPAARIRRGYINNMLFEDHNLGAIFPGGNELFWDRKIGWVEEAGRAGGTVLDAAVDAWGSIIETGENAMVAVFNPLLWERSEVVRIAPDDPVMATLPAFQVEDAATGTVVPAQVLSTGEVAFHAAQIPPLGYRLFRLASTTSALPGPRPLQGMVLQNDAFIVEVDQNTGGTRSIVDVGTGRDITRGDARFNRFVHNGATPYGLRVVSSDSGVVLQRLVIQGMAPGTDGFETEVTLPAGERRINYRNRYNKRRPGGFEGTDFQFGFNMPDATLTYEIPFGHVQLYEDELSGFRTNHYAMQRWSVVSNGSSSAILATDGPAIHAYSAGRFDGIVRLVASFNTIGTAYRAGIGPLETGFSVTSQTGVADAATATRFAYNHSSPLRVRVLPDRQQGSLRAARYSFMSVEGAVLQLSTLKRPIVGNGFIVRLYNPSSEPVTPVVRFSPEVRAMEETTLLEAVIGTIPVADGQAVLPFGPHEVKTLWLDLDVTTVSQELRSTAKVLRVDPNFPNPFSRQTTIPFELAQPAGVRLIVFDILGRKVDETATRTHLPGQHEWTWFATDGQGRPLANGVYFLAVEASADRGSVERHRRTINDSALVFRPPITRIALVLLAVTGLALLIQLGPSDVQAPDGKTLVRYWYIVQSEEAIPYAVRRFNQIQDSVFVQATPIPWQEHEKKILTAILSGDPPDVVSQFVPAVRWASRMALRPLDDLIAATEFDTTVFFPALWEEVTWRGRAFAVPVNTTSYAFFYNRELFQEAGLDPQRPPGTWDEVRQYSQRLLRSDARGNMVQAGFLPGFSGAHQGVLANMATASLIAWQKGVDYLRDGGTLVKMNTPPLNDGIKWTMEFYRDYDFEEVQAFIGGLGTNEQHGFLTGKLAMAVLDMSFLDLLKLYYPELDFGVTAIPTFEGYETVSTAGSWWLGMPRGVGHAEAAWAFMQFYVQQDTQLEEIASRDDPLFPANIRAAYDSTFLARPWMEIFVRQMDHAHSPTVVPLAHGVFWREFYGALERSVYGEQTPEVALLQAEGTIQSALDRALRYDRHVRERMAFFDSE